MVFSFFGPTWRQHDEWRAFKSYDYGARRILGRGDSWIGTPRRVLAPAHRHLYSVYSANEQAEAAFRPKPFETPERSRPFGSGDISATGP